MKGDGSEICFVFNPAANGGKAAQHKEYVQTETERIWPERTWIETGPDTGFWKELAERVNEFELLVACGGDGTVHKAGSIAADSGITLGVIPLGSGNDFAMMNQIPESPKKALSLLSNANRKNIDLIRCNGDVNCWCLNTVGIGLDGLANVFTNEFKQSIGRFAYVLGALKAVMKISACEVIFRTDNSDPFKKEIVMITACVGKREGGAFYVAPEADNRDGKLDLLTVSRINKLKLLIALPQFLIRFPDYMSELHQGKYQKVEIQASEAMNIHVDGELAGKKVQNLSFEIHKHALKIVADPD